jgi:hypothetical protein
MVISGLFRMTSIIFWELFWELFWEPSCPLPVRPARATDFPGEGSTIFL